MWGKNNERCVGVCLDGGDSPLFTGLHTEETHEKRQQVLLQLEIRRKKKNFETSQNKNMEHCLVTDRQTDSLYSSILG